MKEKQEASLLDPISKISDLGFDVRYVSHAHSILLGEFYELLEELSGVLSALDLPITEIIGSGGGETKFTQRLRKSLANLGWKKHEFIISKIVDGVPRESTSHEVDHVKRIEGVGVIACEIEWNNKDPFFDRDLENFKRLHAEGAISVAVLITRGSSLQDSMWDFVHQFAVERKISSFDDLKDNGYFPTVKQQKAVMRRVERKRNPLPFDEAWTDNFVSNKYGQATTHWDKLLPRINRGVGNPCPLLLIGLPASVVKFDAQKIELLDEEVDDDQEASSED